MSTTTKSRSKDALRADKYRPRATSLTPEIHETIVAAIKEGVPIAGAARVARVSRDTVYSWVQRGEKTNNRSAQAAFARDVKEAEGIAEARMAKSWYASALKPDAPWQSKATYLERRWPDRWAQRKPDTQVNLHQHTEIHATLESASTEELVKLANQYSKQAALPVKTE